MPKINRSLLLGLLIVVGIIIYAYGFTVTQVNLAELDSPDRQQSLTRILRALARPDFIEFEKVEVTVETPIFVPCPADGVEPSPAPVAGEPSMVVSPSCADPKQEIVVEGFNFAPNSAGPLNFIPPSGVSLQLAKIETDGVGYFKTTVELRDRVSDEPQLLRAITRQNVGWPHLSQNGRDTIDKIIETVFMALLATTLGTLIAIPISFFAAQNLMRTVTSPVPSVALGIILVPIGVWLGSHLAGWLDQATTLLTLNRTLYAVGVIGAPLVAWGALRVALPPPEEAEAHPRPQLVRIVTTILAVAALLVALYLVADLAKLAGAWLASRLGVFYFVGDFLADLGEILRLIIPPICALIGGGLLAGVAGRLGQRLVDWVSPSTGKIMNLVLGVVAGAVLFVLLGLGIAWLYQIKAVRYVVVWPAVVGAMAGLLVALRTPYDASLRTGTAIYSVTRTILNALRSVEALIMVIVFAVWVGIGPFAGVLALGLHTVAALAKLYSEQVESIMQGPLEAILATGANRLQMIVYAVIPQIVPPYISFTMYRWDINVRMSTIIGFAGGGGIGFLLQQNINLLNYRAASAQIIAIAIVVSAMDYLSSALRQRTL